MWHPINIRRVITYCRDTRRYACLFVINMYVCMYVHAAEVNKVIQQQRNHQRYACLNVIIESGECYATNKNLPTWRYACLNNMIHDA